ncbi:MAG: glycosyltransferase [Myxococcota bacterium]
MAGAARRLPPRHSPGADAVIFIVVGTHEDPFDRLVRAAELIAGSGRKVVLQKGTSQVPSPSCDSVAWMTPEQMEQSFDEASVVVCHGGPSTIVEAGQHGHVAIVVPRQARFAEHVDDHQLRFAQRIADRVRVIEHIQALQGAILEHEAWAKGRRPLGCEPERVARFADGVEAVCTRVIDTPRAPSRVRDRLRALRRWIQAR